MRNTPTISTCNYTADNTSYTSMVTHCKAPSSAMQPQPMTTMVTYSRPRYRLDTSSKGSTGSRPGITNTELSSSDTNSALDSIDSVNTLTMHSEEI